jgi:hypothetical protein
MAFFDALGRVIGGGARDPRRENRLAEAQGVDASGPSPEYPGGQGVPADPAEMASPPVAGTYDREHWRRKAKRILEKLPASQSEWPTLMAEAHALKLDQDWVDRCLLDEFTLLVRHAVRDRHVTREEHSKLDLARQLIGLSEEEAVDLLHAVVAEAEAFFGKPVEGA